WRNDGSAGFSDQTEHFPFAAGRIVDAALFDLVPDNNETDLAALYADGSIVIYRDRLLGHYEAQRLPTAVTGGVSIQALDINNDGWTDLMTMGTAGPRLLLNDRGKLAEGPAACTQKGAMVLADLGNRSLTDLVVNGSLCRNGGNGNFQPAATLAIP